MPDWLIWVAIGLFLMSCRGGCRVGVKRVRGHGDRTRERRPEDLTRTSPRPKLAGGPEEWLGHGSRSRTRNAATSAPTPRRETPLEALQRRFVTGSMTVEQYEAELDRLERLE